MAAVQVAFIRNVCGSPFLIFSFSQVFSSFLKNDNFKKYFTQERSIYESNSARRAVSEKSCIRLGFVLHVYSGYNNISGWEYARVRYTRPAGT